MVRLPAETVGWLPQNSPSFLTLPTSYPETHYNRPEPSLLPAPKLTAGYPKTHANRPQRSQLEVINRRNQRFFTP
jgi:hypothetical protein